MMTAKQWLGRARGLDREVNMLLRERDNARAQLLRITQSYERSEAQATKDPHKYDRLLEYEAAIDAKIDELLAVKAEILTAIARLENRAQRMALTEYYIEFKTWEQVAVDLHYTFRGIMLIRKNAIAEVEKIRSAENYT